MTRVVGDVPGKLLCDFESFISFHQSCCVVLFVPHLHSGPQEMFERAAIELGSKALFGRGYDCSPKGLGPSVILIQRNRPSIIGLQRLP
jgi:hypothetical protein